MKIIVVACMLANPGVCKTLTGTVAYIDTHAQCAEAIREKAKDYPKWEVKSYKCEKA